MTNEIIKLINGNKKFRKKFYNSKNNIFDELVQGQKPKTMIVSCCDSRVDPAMIFNCLPGELFVIRNVANLVPPCQENDSYHGVSAALEFGVTFLKVKNIIILGHSQCGGIQALVKSNEKLIDKSQSSFISKWMELAMPAIKQINKLKNKLTLDEKILLCEKFSLINSLNNLYTFDWINKRVNKGKLLLNAWYFDLETGRIHQYDKQKNDWVIY